MGYLEKGEKGLGVVGVGCSCGGAAIVVVTVVVGLCY